MTRTSVFVFAVGVAALASVAWPVMSSGTPAARRAASLGSSKSVLVGSATTREPERVILTRVDIEAAGIARLGDILRLIDDWDVTTLDGFTWRASPLGLGAPLREQWRVMIDGQLVEMNVFGASSLNHLPIAVSQLDSVEIVTVPQIYSGEFVDAGLIHFHTRNEKEALRVRLLAGNETGDPGPYQFTRFSSPNVERLGPDASVTGSYSNRWLRGQATWVRRRDHVSDDNVRTRNQAIVGGIDTRLRVEAGSLKLRSDAFTGTHALWLGYSQFDDFFFLKPLGREIPVDRTYLQGGLSGGVPLKGNATIAYRLTYAANDLGRRSNALGLDADWRQIDRSLTIGVTEKRGRYEHEIGFSVKKRTADTDRTLSQDAILITELSGRFSYRWNDAWSQAIGVALANGETETAIRFYTAQHWRRGAADFDVTAGFSERLPEEDGRIWYWNERGYSLLEDNGVDVDRTGGLGVAQRFHVDAKWRSMAGRDFHVGASGYFRDFSNLDLEKQVFDFRPADVSFHAPVALESGQDGQVGGLKLTLAHGGFRDVKARVYYRYQTSFAGSAAFEDEWGTVPEHRLRQVLTYTPVKDLTLSSILSAWSESEWPDYRKVRAQSGGRYQSTVDGAVRLDLVLQDYFWRRRLRGSLAFQNILSDEIRYHPIGASFDLTVFLQIEWAAGGF